MCAWHDEVRVRRDCEDAFAAADDGQKGYLTAEDYKVAILSLFGYKPSRYEVLGVWRDNCDASGGSHGGLTKDQFVCLTKDQFVSLVAQRIQRQDKDGMARQVFLAFDVCCKGFLTERDCLRAFQSVAPHLATDRIPDLFREVDWNRDGRVSYKDFELMMKHIISEIPNNKPHT